MHTATTTSAPLAGLAPSSSSAEPGGASSYRKAAGWVIASLWIAAIVYVLVLYVATGQRPFDGIVVEQIILLVLWGAATPAILRAAQWLPIERAHWVRRPLVHGTIASAFIIALNVVGLTLAWVVMGRPTPYTAVVRHAITELLRAFHLALIVYAFILGAGH